MGVRAGGGKKTVAGRVIQSKRIGQQPHAVQPRRPAWITFEVAYRSRAGAGTLGQLRVAEARR